MVHSFYCMLCACGLFFVAQSISAALPDNAVLTIDGGNGDCSMSNDTLGNLTHTGNGSCFGLESNPVIPIISQITGHDGLVIGEIQPAFNSHSGPPSGSEKPAVDEPWQFFGNTGMHFTHLPVVELGPGQLDFSGWSIAWNGIPLIEMGSGAHNNGFTDGIARFDCESSMCALGDTYVLEYSATVFPDDPSGVGSVPYTLHLEGVVSNTELTPVDTDHDDVNNLADVCPGTVIPESIPTVRLNTNRWALLDDDTDFDTTAPKGSGPRRSFSVADTAGCSCEQIIAVLDLNKSQQKFGCSTRSMDGWVALPK